MTDTQTKSVLPDTEKGAKFSDDKLHRFTLTRKWAEGPQACFIMLNPSTADAMKDDPTIRRCIAFSIRERCGSLVVINLYTYRTAYPEELIRYLKTKPMPDPEEVPRAHWALNDTDGPIICAWGAHPLARRGEQNMFRLIEAMGKKAMCFGLTKEGYPRHPLYVPATEKLVPYTGRQPAHPVRQTDRKEGR